MLERDESGEFKDWNITVPDHVLVMERYQLWIPLDRAVEVTKAILNFLTEKQMGIVFRHIERSAMFLSSSGVLSEADGMHTVVRAWMRRFQNTGTPSHPEDTSIPQGSERYTIVVNMEKVLEA